MYVVHSGNLFRWSTILWLKKCFLISNWELFLYSFKLCPFKSVVVAFCNYYNFSEFNLFLPVRILYGSIRSPPISVVHVTFYSDHLPVCVGYMNFILPIHLQWSHYPQWVCSWSAVAVSPWLLSVQIFNTFISRSGKDLGFLNQLIWFEGFRHRFSMCLFSQSVCVVLQQYFFLNKALQKQYRYVISIMLMCHLFWQISQYHYI